MKFFIVAGALVLMTLWARWLAFKKRRSNPAIAVAVGASVAVVVALVAVVVKLWGV
jgi:hypothetical protein